MDFYRNMSVVTGGGGNGGFPSSEYSPEEQLVVSPSSTPYSKFGVVSSSCCSVDDLFSTQNMEQEAGDVNIEWLSNLVEDCLSNTGNCTYQQPLPINDQPLNVKKQHYSSVSLVDNHKIENIYQNQNQSTTPAPPSLQNFLSSPTGNTRTKRRRTTKLPRKPLSSSTSNYNSRSSSSWSSHQEGKDPQNQKPNHHVVMTTTSEYMTPPLLVHQAYWLADSELINVPQNESTNNSSGGTTFTATTTTIDEDDEQQEFMIKMEEEEEEESRGKDSLGNLGQPRRCAHCLSQRTPQWRAGPLGPKTLCNACGVRFKSGRLLPEYRPAKSPTFVSYKHSNSHKKVLEMRMSVLPSSVHSE